MKYLFLCLLVFVFFVTSCSKKQDENKPVDVKESILKNSGYTNITDNYENSVGAFVRDKAEPDTVFDFNIDITYKTVNDNQKATFAQTKDKLMGKYPLLFGFWDNDDKDAYASILLPNLIKIEISSMSCNSPKWKNPELYKQVLEYFDIEGLEKITGDKVAGTELAKYLPKIPKLY